MKRDASPATSPSCQPCSVGEAEEWARSLKPKRNCAIVLRSQRNKERFGEIIAFRNLLAHSAISFDGETVNALSYLVLHCALPRNRS